MKPIRTDFTGYEGKYVAIDARTGKIVIADEDPKRRPRGGKGPQPCRRSAAASRIPASRSTSALAELEPLPWLYPYREDPYSTRLGPAGIPSLRCRFPWLTPGETHDGAGWIGRHRRRRDPRQRSARRRARHRPLRQRGRNQARGRRQVPSGPGTRRLRCDCIAGDAEVGEYREWQAQVGFIEGWHSYSFVLLGSVGFLDRFTVTASRFAHSRRRGRPRRLRRALRRPPRWLTDP